MAQIFPSNASPSKARANRYFGFYLAIIFFIISFGLGILVGQALKIRQSAAGESLAAAGQAAKPTLTIKDVFNLNRETNRSDSIDFDQFWQIWDRVKEKYVKQPVKDADMFYGAVQGLVMSLGDPYSIYMPPQAAEEFTKDLSGELEGIGAEVGIKNNQLLIVAPLPETPAEKAGLRPGDKVLMIDKEITAGMDINTAVSKIRGKGGTPVTLTISRDGLTEAKEVTIIRAKIIVPSVLFTAKDNNIAYLRIMQFNQDTIKIFNKYIKQMKKNGVHGIVLDMRGNPGGYLDAAIEMASEWVKEGVIVSEKGNQGRNNNHYTTGEHRLADIKTVVLVNKGSASASEIVAGALQDYKKATVIGEKTYGKGSVQDYETFPDGSALKLTIAEWYTPNGKNINQEGITPDIEIKEDWDKTAVGEDPALNKALEILK